MSFRWFASLAALVSASALVWGCQSSESSSEGGSESGTNPDGEEAGDGDGDGDETGDGDGDASLEPSPPVEEILEQPEEDWPRFLHYIRSDSFDRLVLEIDETEGFEADQDAVSRVVATLSGILDKPAGVEFIRDDTLESKGSDHLWEFEALDESVRATFGGDDGKEIRIHVSYLDGSYDTDGEGTVLGLAWSYRNIAMFKESINRTCARLPLLGMNDCEAAEEAILLHEVGHVLGLVDNGLAMVEDHRDPDEEHGAHDADPDCVMYWAYDGEAVFDALGSLVGSGDSVTFCEESLADIEAAKESGN